MEHPVFRPSGISYLHIPTTEPQQSAAFYKAVFGWKVGGRPEHPSFEDGTGHVIGAWETGLRAMDGVGVELYIYVDNVQATLDKVVEQGGQIVKTPYPEGNLIVATFRDPGDNVIGVWQQSSHG